MDAADLARRFGLGRAVKVPFGQPDENEVRSAAAFQEAACAAGVPAPHVRRTTEGCVFAALGDRRVRVYEWVDLAAPDTELDPDLVGAVVAAIHRVSVAGTGPLDPWYHEPVGAARWDHLIGQLAEVGAPFAAGLAALRDELVALESWVEPPEMLQAYREAGGPAAVNRRGHFSMLIAQLGHITDTAATGWLTPNSRSPDRADSAAWASEVLDEPHTRELLGTILAAADDGAAPY
jgi:hypothetical protein